MIPAILSCVFVLFLYRTLNQVDADEASAGDAVDSPQLAARLESLNQRVETLLNKMQQGDRS